MTALGTRKLTLDIGGVERAPEVSKAVITSGASDSDFTSFEDAAAGGGRSYGLNIIATQDADSASLWSEVWDNAGQDIPFILRPYGNAVATVAQPHFEGTATISEPDGDLLGGEANASNSARFTFEVTWSLTGKPTRVTA